MIFHGWAMAGQFACLFAFFLLNAMHEEFWVFCLSSRWSTSRKLWGYGTSQNHHVSWVNIPKTMEHHNVFHGEKKTNETNVSMATFVRSTRKV